MTKESLINQITDTTGSQHKNEKNIKLTYKVYDKN